MNTNAYQLIVPEAQEILAEIEPWFNVLRFFPKLKQSNTRSDDLTAAMSRVVVSPKLTRADPIAERLYEAHVTCCRLRSVPLRDKSVQAPTSELPWVAALVPFLSPPFESS
ncbi:hypothetical protein SDRG_03901 [Saprolegnia diclina VS20]|uniref:Uncharacterized protein n=1 Tax=Saprolegnia diclina (strain VS20) TaxID=1156394 RepID=T0QWA1_SAPDV|nr:hypothetical protein SDRG_03901 [Saprolegnia diclina VS20]EQC38946.1 hypothetical protein SDRG_03901 [Saprolegnia diclina VS20]|eukprot:XP_008607770.1 hypothetical protein SDRG_03901 [Saprolegnia diclina VS20]